MKHSEDQLAAIARSAVVTAVAAAFPFIGLGDAARATLDTAAARSIGGVLSGPTARGDLAVVACEGKRDGAWTLPTLEPARGMAYAYCDPVDGTLNAARGGPRSFSVLGLGFRPPSWHCRLDDAFSVFAVGSRVDEIDGMFGPNGDWAAYLSRAVADPTIRTATLNRADNMKLLHDLGGPARDGFEIGSRNGYRPTLRAPGLLAVGDATVTLAFESQVEFGRIGLVEAQIESVLQRGWAGLLVSRDRIREVPGGTAEYLHRYLAARRHVDLPALAALFTDPELACLTSLGIDLMTATRPLDRESFGVGLDGLVVIAALCSDRDPWLAQDTAVLENPVWRPIDAVLHIDSLTASTNRTERAFQCISPRESPEISPEIRRWYSTFDWESTTSQEGTG